MTRYENVESAHLLQPNSDKTYEETRHGYAAIVLFKTL